LTPLWINNDDVNRRMIDFDDVERAGRLKPSRDGLKAGKGRGFPSLPRPEHGIKRFNPGMNRPPIWDWLSGSMTSLTDTLNELR
jgi:hypothetical protein